MALSDGIPHEMSDRAALNTELSLDSLDHGHHRNTEMEATRSQGRYTPPPPPSTHFMNIKGGAASLISKKNDGA